jgi:uncharacterized RDD family membrane protein YckC
MVVKCSHCGHALAERSKFCPSCGTPRSNAGSVVGSHVRMADGGEAAIELTAPPPSSQSQRRIVLVNSSSKGEPAEAADFGQRLGAFLFDLLLFMILLMASTFVLSSFSRKSIVSSNAMLLAFYLVAFALYAFNYVLLAARDGQTIGKRLVGIRVVRENGEPVGLLQVFLRHVVGYTLSLLGGFLGFMWVIWDSKYQGWHDKIARTIVVLAR